MAGSVAGALEAVHAAGVIHRDLKPSNIVLPGAGGDVRFGEATLIDLGAFGELVRRSRSQELTQAGEFFGTPYYMAPEQISASPQSAATDLHGLGILLYEMLFGRPPFFGEPLISFLGKRLKDDIPLPPEPALPGEVRSLLGDLLQRDPAARPRSASEVRRRLEGIGAGLGAPRPARESTGVVAVPAPPKAPADSSSREVAAEVEMEHTAVVAAPPPAPRAARKGRVGLVGALYAVVLLVTLVFAVGRIRPKSGTGGRGAPEWVAGVILGLLLIGGGAAGGVALSRFLRRRGGDIQREAGRLLLGAKSRDILTSTLALEIDELIARCRRVDERILGITIAQMMGEYRGAASSNERQAALMNAAQLLEKLMSRLSPWYVRQEKALAFAVSLVGVLTGVVSLVASILKLLGKP